jgi:hypothetical protein
MRDIRGDLQDRANLFVEQINAAQSQFDKLIDQLKREHDSRLESLKSDLDAVHLVTGIEDRLLVSVPSATKAQPQSRAPQQSSPREAHPQRPPSDILARKISAVGVR